MKRKASHAFAAVVMLLITPAVLPAAPPGSLEGTWSAPSLSRRDVPILVTIFPGGKATERIGTYHGEGAWKLEGNSVRITWSSEWVGLLRPAAEGTYELLTWKKRTPANGPPDDIQPAKRISPTGPAKNYNRSTLKPKSISLPPAGVTLSGTAGASA